MMNGITRREFLTRGAAAAGVLAAGLSLSESASGASERPNILFILTDDQRFDALGFMGRPGFLKTPNLDRIAREGAHVRNAFVTTALCSPSRASFMTGCYAHKHGVVTNEGMDPDPSCPTFAQILQKAGYETAFVGKWHQAPKSDPRPGFDYWLSFKGQGVYEDPMLNENGREFRATGYMSDILTDHAVEFLEKKRDKPFCMVLSHKAVHEPFTPAPRHKDAFADASIPEPASHKDTFTGKPAWMRRAFTYGIRRTPWANSEGEPIPDKLNRGSWNGTRMLDYYRSILAIDDSVGKVLDTLEKAGQLDNTVVVFAGDNGYFIGEHGLGDKRLMYEESIRIPMLVRYPKLVKAGTKADGTVLNIDLAPTLLELAGEKIPEGMQGRSMVPVLKGKPGHDAFFYEYFREGWVAGLPLMHGVRTDRWKYVCYPDMNDIDELYDLKADPTEMRNLAQDPAHAARVKEMKDEMERLKKVTGYPEGVQLGSPPVVGEKVERVIGKVMAFDFSKGDAKDLSGQGNDGTIHGGKFVEDGGKKVLRLEKGDFIEVPSSPMLDPGQINWYVTMRAKPESPNGILFAHGGESNGYALYLQDSHIILAIRREGKLSAFKSIYPVDINEWSRFVINITRKHVVIGVDGKPVPVFEDTGEVGWLTANPVEGLQVGIDNGSHVGSYTDANPFVGLIERIDAYAGKIPLEQ